MNNIHEKAAKGFEIAGDAYDRGRPEYPQEAIHHLIQELNLNSTSTIADLGAGTGKFTKLLQPTKAKIIAIEPVNGMIEKFRSLHPAIEIKQGSAEEIPLPANYLDAVVAAQAFHWFNAKNAIKEIHRVLKPKGKLALIWNARDESIDWIAKLTDIIDPHEGGAPRYKNMEWKKAFTQTKLFSPLILSQFSYTQSGPPSMVVDRIASISFISALPEAKKAEVLQQVSDLLATHPQTKGKPVIELPYRTDLFICAKL